MISYIRLHKVLIFFALQSLSYCYINALSSTKLAYTTFHNFKSRSASLSKFQASLDPSIENFEKSWVEHNIVAKSVKHTSFDWVCGKLRGLQATTSQFKKGSAVISVPYSETLSASDKGLDGCPEGCLCSLLMSFDNQKLALEISMSFDRHELAKASCDYDEFCIHRWIVISR